MGGPSWPLRAFQTLPLRNRLVLSSAQLLLYLWGGAGETLSTPEMHPPPFRPDPCQGHPETLSLSEGGGKPRQGEGLAAGLQEAKWPGEQGTQSPGRVSPLLCLFTPSFLMGNGQADVCLAPALYTVTRL